MEACSLSVPNPGSANCSAWAIWSRSRRSSTGCQFSIPARLRPQQQPSAAVLRGTGSVSGSEMTLFVASLHRRLFASHGLLRRDCLGQLVHFIQLSKRRLLATSPAEPSQDTHRPGAVYRRSSKWFRGALSIEASSARSNSVQSDVV
jgi:hypothetical protein